MVELILESSLREAPPRVNPGCEQPGLPALVARLRSSARRRRREQHDVAAWSHHLATGTAKKRDAAVRTAMGLFDDHLALIAEHRYPRSAIGAAYEDGFFETFETLLRDVDTVLADGHAA